MKDHAVAPHLKRIYKVIVAGLMVSTATTLYAGYTPPAPAKIDISKGLPRPVSLTGPIVVGVGGGTQSPSNPAGEENNQGGWATLNINAITNMTPSLSELKDLAAGSGEAAGFPLGDDTFVSPLQPSYAKTSKVVLELPVSFAETINQVTGLNNSCGGPVCVPGYQSDGDTGEFSARPEICLPGSLPGSKNGTKLSQVKDTNNKPISCHTANGVQGLDGYWYDLEKPWSSVVYLNGKPPTGANWTQTQPPTLVYKGTISMTVDLPVPVNSIRVEVKLGLKDQPIDSNSPYVKTLWGTVTGHNSSGDATLSPVGGPENVLTRFAIQLPKITVLPAAFVQMKVLPYTILYRPPGDKSTGSFSTTQSYGTTLTTGVSTAIDNTTAFMESQGVQNSTSVTALIATVALQGNSTSSTTNSTDINGTIGTGLVTGSSHSVVRTWTLGAASSDPTILPASQYITPNTCTAANYTSAGCALNPPESFKQEPFWGDRIVLLLDPSAELYNFSAGTTMQLLGGSDMDIVSVLDLFNCATNTTTQKGHKLSNGVYLTPAECEDLLALDPYYTEGQATDPSQYNRGVAVGGGNYGPDPQNPTAAGVSVAFSDIFTTTTTQTVSASASYMASVTSVQGFSWSQGLTIAAKVSQYNLDAGFSTGTTITSGYQQTTGNQMKVTYTNSTAATSTNTTTISGSFADDHDFDTPACQKNSGSCYSPSVDVYIDELFGSYMFSDPNAPANPLLNILHRAPIPTKIPIKIPIKK